MSGLIDNSAKVTKSKSKKTKNDNSKDGFRLNSAQIFLTYSQCPIEPSIILEFIKNVVAEWELDTYIIAQEKHKDNNLHLHAYIKLKNKPNKRNAERLFDFGEYHPKVETCRSWKNVIKYVSKDGNYITNIDEDELKKILLANTKVGEIYEKAFNVAREKGVEAGMKELETVKTFRDLLVHGEAIEKNMKKLRAEDNNVMYKLEDFKPIEFVWNRRKTLVLTGPSDTGKTSLALAMLPNCLFVSDLDDLREYNTGKYKGIVFDDMCFMPDVATGKGGLDREKQIALFDMDQPRHIKCRYHNAKIPANTPKICTSNLHIDNVCLYTDPAIRKRVQHVEIRDKCYLDSSDTISTNPPQTPVVANTTTISNGNNRWVNPINLGGSALDALLDPYGTD